MNVILKFYTLAAMLITFRSDIAAIKQLKAVNHPANSGGLQ